MKKWWWLLILLLVLLGLLFGWWWMNKDDTAATNTNETSESAPAETVACAEGTTAYENTELGLGFCYPTEWGDVSVVDAKFATADTGSRWTVGFADKSMVNLGVVSADWSTAVARDGTCVDPAVQTLPAFSPFSTAWATEGTPVSSATRGIEVEADKFLIQEHVDDLLTNGACVEGYTIIEGDPYTHTSASYWAFFTGSITTPQQHIDNPNALISEENRTDFYDFVKSVHKL
jgi:hypothetical protein